MVDLGNERFGYGLRNGTIGVYSGTTRLWRVKSKHRVQCLAPIRIGEQAHFFSGWSNGKVHTLVDWYIQILSLSSKQERSKMGRSYVVNRSQLLSWGSSPMIFGGVIATILWSALLKATYVDTTPLYLNKQDSVMRLLRNKAPSLYWIRNWK